MSRSYYNFPSFKDYGRNYTSWSKRQASKAARRIKDIGNGADYKKAYCQYDIFDYRSTYYTDQQVRDSWYAEDELIYKIPKKNFVKHFRRDSIRYMMDTDDNL